MSVLQFTSGSPETAAVTVMREDDNNIHISDVIEVIETDPDFKQSTMFNVGSEISLNHILPTIAPSQSTKPKVKIIEQPAYKDFRFRYESEGRFAGSIPGVSSTPKNKTFPAIQIIGYQGRAVVVVSCVTTDLPYRPHPHNLVGREGCKKGVCTLQVSPETMSVKFSNLGIQCVRIKDIEAALKVREEVGVDPFRTGFAHRNQPTSIDLNEVRLCFQVFLEGDHRGKFTVPLTPVVSEPIHDKKAVCDLVIVKLFDCVSSVDGGRKDIVLLCNKVKNDDIQIRFYEEQDGQVMWEGFGDFQPSQVHMQTAIWFRAPRYKTLDVTEPVKVFIQLRRPSDGATSEPLPFELLPLDSEPGMLKRKRQKFGSNPRHQLLLQLQEQEKNRARQPHNLLNISMDAVIPEPRDTSPSPYRSQMYEAVSPMYAGNPALSPQQQYRMPVDLMGSTPRMPVDLMGSTPSPTNLQCNLPYNVALNTVSPLSGSVLPSINNMLPQNWNIPTSAMGELQNDLAASSTMNIDTPSSLSSLLDLDSQQLELKQINLNSSELATLHLFDTNNLSENLCNNLSLTDIVLRQEQNMIDSLTCLANNGIDSICQLNDMYKPN